MQSLSRVFYPIILGVKKYTDKMYWKNCILSIVDDIKIELTVK